MKLYEAPRGRWLRLAPEEHGEAQVPPSALPVDAYRTFKLDHIDGMYSLCRDREGNILHPAAWTEVEVVKFPPIVEKDGKAFIDEDTELFPQ
jgi:hypothetical protein